MRCQWRPVSLSEVGTEHLKHMPGTCRVCWKPCHAVVEPGTGLHCPDCLDALATHPNAEVRSALAAEPDVSRDVLELLATDGNYGVQNVASTRLKREMAAATTDNDNPWG